MPGKPAWRSLWRAAKSSSPRMCPGLGPPQPQIRLRKSAPFEHVFDLRRQHRRGPPPIRRVPASRRRRPSGVCSLNFGEKMAGAAPVRRGINADSNELQSRPAGTKWLVLGRRGSKMIWYARFTAKRYGAARAVAWRCAWPLSHAPPRVLG